MRTFADRLDAGRRLGERVREGLGAGPGGPFVVLGLPRGGVPVAAEVAAALSAPLDVLLVRKVRAPGHRELAMGAVGEDGVLVRNPEVVSALQVGDEQFRTAARREQRALARRAERYRTVRGRIPIAGCTAIVVDDGVATGATARAACAVARARGAAAVLLATPVIARSTADEFVRADPVAVESLVAVLRPETFGGVGQFYDDFTPTSDEEVMDILRSASRR